MTAGSTTPAKTTRPTEPWVNACGVRRAYAPRVARRERQRTQRVPRAAWTDARGGGSVRLVAARQCSVTTAGLVELAGLIDRLRSQPVSDAAVRRTCRTSTLSTSLAASDRAGRTSPTTRRRGITH